MGSLEDGMGCWALEILGVFGVSDVVAVWYFFVFGLFRYILSFV